jgi:hypothetical protein
MPRAKRPRDPAQLAKFIVDVATGEIEDKEPASGKDAAAAALGSKGGKARAQSMSAAKRTEIAAKAAKLRWAKKRD